MFSNKAIAYLHSAYRPSRAGMRPNDLAVYGNILQTGLFGEMTKELAPCATGAPARKPFEDAVPFAMLRRQNPPFMPYGYCEPERNIHKHALMNCLHVWQADMDARHNFNFANSRHHSSSLNSIRPITSKSVNFNLLVKRQQNLEFFWNFMNGLATLLRAKHQSSKNGNELRANSNGSFDDSVNNSRLASSLDRVCGIGEFVASMPRIPLHFIRATY